LDGGGGKKSYPSGRGLLRAHKTEYPIKKSPLEKKGEVEISGGKQLSTSKRFGVIRLPWQIPAGKRVELERLL